VSSRRLKKQILPMLEQENYEFILEHLRMLPAKDVVNVLFSAICREVPRIRWVAISCMGETVARLAEENMEEARIIMRRLLWSLNDESGGIGWGAPESLAEIMCHQAQLAEEYCHMLVSYMQKDGDELLQDGNFLELPSLQKGLLWGVGRLAGSRPGLLSTKVSFKDVAPFLTSSDQEICGLAAWITGSLGMIEAKSELHKLTGDKRELFVYEDGELQAFTVGELAGSALQRMQ